ncbi:MAG: cryptochrome/photolyase family protein [Gemmataceae bacterium]|nr:cryptochrome/photolyase family protein [Gemmataceae bacterium]
MSRRCRHLVLVLGDQLDQRSAAFDGFDPKVDVVLMAEVTAESTHVWSSKPRTVLFLSAMRHFRAVLAKRGITVRYVELEDPANTQSLAGELERAAGDLKPAGIVVVQPGEFRVRAAVRESAARLRVSLDERPDRHFLSTPEEFAAHARGRKQLRLEYFYRELRQKTGVLMDGDQPEGGQWNFDAENRGHFGKSGPGLLLPEPRSFPPDAITRDVIAIVNRRFADHPGRLDSFDWPVTVDDARAALDDFIANRLPDFGRYQDAMWSARPYLYHSRLAAAMNLKLLDPRDVIAAAEAAYRNKHAPLEAVEGFIRQILGWREYVRGIYWHFMPEYAERNALGGRIPLPQFYWTGQTEMNCLRDAIGQTLEYGYAHHIQRLMVTGLYSLLLGVVPREVHEWYLAVYVDAVEWVELPNTVGMALHADGGVMASKPYCASGRYIQRMSNYCTGCRYDAAESVGDDACPFTTLYWDFLARHEAQWAKNPRMSMQLKNLKRIDADTRAAIRRQAAYWQTGAAGGAYNSPQ